MENQKQSTLELVAAHRGQGRKVSEVLSSMGVARSNYYRWKKEETPNKADRHSSYEVTAEERGQIDEVKGQYPQYRHRRIEGVLQQRGVYLSASVIYGHLKAQGQIEPYQRRAAPWKEPRYEVWQRNLMWGSDWTKLRVDRGSPNTSGITQEFFEGQQAELSFARVRRPTDNALTERFYVSIKQEEIYVVGNYPDEISAKEEIGRYIESYHHSRPHQSLMNFTPAHVHQVNSKSVLLAELKEMKRRTREKRKAYWTEREKLDEPSIEGGCPGKGPRQIVDPGANMEEIFEPKLSDSQNEGPTTKNDLLDSSILSH